MSSEASNYKEEKKGPMSLALKNHVVAMLGEFVGTMSFLIYALGGTSVALTASNNVTSNFGVGDEGLPVSAANSSNLLYIALCFGVSLGVNVWIFFRVSGGMFNPAVTLGLVLGGALDPIRGLLVFPCQLAGGIVGAVIIAALTPGPFNCRTTLGDGVSVAQGLFIEMFLTALLVLAIFFLAVEKHKATFIAPVGIGAALFIAHMLGVFYTGASLNPARTLAPSVATKTFATYEWIYWLGPFMGAALSAAFYRLMKLLDYQTVLGVEDYDIVPPKALAPTDEEKSVGIGATAERLSRIEAILTSMASERSDVLERK